MSAIQRAGEWKRLGLAAAPERGGGQVMGWHGNTWSARWMSVAVVGGQSAVACCGQRAHTVAHHEEEDDEHAPMTP